MDSLDSFKSLTRCFVFLVSTIFGSKDVLVVGNILTSIFGDLQLPTIDSLGILGLNNSLNLRRPIFNDDFNGDKLDLTKWKVDTGCEGFSSGLLNCFVGENSCNLQLANGYLTIKAIPECYESKNFTSARIRQRGSGFYTGIFISRMKLPKGLQLWPAFWLLESPSTKVDERSKCRYEEIDILQYKGDNTSTIHMVAHYGRNSSSSGLVTKFNSTFFDGVDFSEDFHEFGLVWTRTSLTWYVDSKMVHEISTKPSVWETNGLDKIPCFSNHSPFSNPMQIILNLSVGGADFFGNDAPISMEQATNWTQPTLTIDWVRVYSTL